MSAHMNNLNYVDAFAFNKSLCVCVIHVIASGVSFQRQIMVLLYKFLVRSPKNGIK